MRELNIIFLFSWYPTEGIICQITKPSLDPKWHTIPIFIFIPQMICFLAHSDKIFCTTITTMTSQYIQLQKMEFTMLIKKFVPCPLWKKEAKTRALFIFDQDKTLIGLWNKRENNNNSRTFSFFGSNLILYTFLDAPSNSTTIASAQWLKMFNSTVLRWP